MCAAAALFVFENDSPMAQDSEKPKREERSYVERALRLVDGKPQRVTVAEGFIVPGLETEAKGLGFGAFVERVEHMAELLETTGNVTVVSIRYERQEPKPPYARVEVRLPEYDLPQP